ncbi:DUF4386 domain-containing protein [Demequina sp. NBRC 110053]|uniref:DUF4386 domain-containing protein n=1 Tax=Demequina sp. NBRC 110053 TaxID=1570342 RepID=UPI000A07596B|nr:DUF4386 domain-containing protein [Demequina sp. NBRC 110053]
MTTDRRLSVLAGASYLLTHFTSVGAVVLYGPMLTVPGWAAQAGSGPLQLLGALLDVVLAVGIVGTAVFLLPLVRRRTLVGAAGYLSLRGVEAAVVLMGAAAVMAAVSMRAAGADPAGAGAMVALYDMAFLVGPGLIVPVHTVLLATVLWRYRLTPRLIPLLGFVGGPLVLASNLTVLFGVQDQVSALVALAAVPVFAWEISLASFLIARGLRGDVAARGDGANVSALAARTT